MQDTVLLKITGEALGDPKGKSLNIDNIRFIVDEIKDVLKNTDCKLVIVVGGGNFIRGKDLKPDFFDESTPDRMGMICTVLNALALKDQLQKNKLETRVMSSVSIPQVCEEYIQPRALRHIEKGRIVILAGGTGTPNFTTDMAAVEKALDIGAVIVLKATKVDGLYTSDPEKNSGAKLIKQISCSEVIEKGFSVMDYAAFGLAKEKGMPIRIFNLFKKGNLLKAIKGEIGSEIY